MAAKQRIDLLLTEKGLFPTREKAKSAIMAGIVKVGGKVVDKAGTEVDPEALIEVTGPALPYVSRGGLKLEQAIRVYELDLSGLVTMDVGASTGGFTDCALQNGAKKVYAIDVGYGQLDWKLRNDPRVVNMERTNFRYLDPSLIKDSIDFVTIDVAFISLGKILPKVMEIINPGSRVVALIKPQFEAGREKVGKKGVVRDPETHREVIKNVTGLALGLGFRILGLTYSPIKGPEGNIEYLLYMIKEDNEGQDDTGNMNSYPDDLINQTVSNAFSTL